MRIFGKTERDRERERDGDRDRERERERERERALLCGTTGNGSGITSDSRPKEMSQRLLSYEL